MKKCTSETNYPCFLSANSVQGFFKSSMIGVKEKLYQITANSQQEKQNLYNGRELWGDGVA
jgi:hypothetical protein